MIPFPQVLLPFQELDYLQSVGISLLGMYRNVVVPVLGEVLL